MKRKTKAVSMVELLVTLIICAVLVLIISSISNISSSSYEKERRQAEVYNNIYYGFSLMKFKIRNAGSITVDNGNKTLTFGSGADAVTFKCDTDDFIYQDAAGNHTIVPDVTNLVFDFRCVKGAGDSWIADSCTNSSNIFHITLSGEHPLGIGRPQGTGTQGSVKFDLSTEIKKRN